MKQCSKCKETKPYEDFSKDKNRKDGHYARCKLCTSAYKKTYYSKNKEEVKSKVKEYYLNNRDLCKERMQTYYENNKSYFQEYKAKYYEKNKAHYVAYSTFRKSRVKKATPDWLSDDDRLRIAHMYKLRELKSFVEGEEYHVDHIVPLRGENVCGLHVPWNLQLLPAKENLSKGNKF